MSKTWMIYPITTSKMFLFIFSRERLGRGNRGKTISSIDRMRRARGGLPRRKWLLRCCKPWRKWASQWDHWQLRRCAEICPSPRNKLPSTSRNKDESLSRVASTISFESGFSRV